VSAPGKIGPGRIVLVVGPSGAGKDTLIAGARVALAGNPNVVFARRVVTRPSSDAEDHESIAEAEFQSAASRGDFAFWWEAHDLSYGIPASVNDDIRVGRTVVCNTSRTMLSRLITLYANPVVVLVTAPEDILASRRKARSRNDAGVESRSARVSLDAEVRADFVIRNVRDLETGIAALTDIIRGIRPRTDFPAEMLF
jgi:ribose 1,5-bisphosphokinase